MDWKIFVLSAIVFTSYVLFWVIWSGNTLGGITYNDNTPSDLQCSDSMVLFLYILHYGYLALLWLPILGPLVLYCSYNQTGIRSFKLDLALGIIAIAGIAFCVLWFFLVILLWLIVWYDKEVCPEASELVGSYLITSSILTTAMLVVIGFQLALRRRQQMV